MSKRIQELESMQDAARKALHERLHDRPVPVKGDEDAPEKTEQAAPANQPEATSPTETEQAAPTEQVVKPEPPEQEQVDYEAKYNELAFKLKREAEKNAAMEAKIAELQKAQAQQQAPAPAKEENFLGKAEEIYGDTDPLIAQVKKMDRQIASIASSNDKMEQMQKEIDNLSQANIVSNVQKAREMVGNALTAYGVSMEEVNKNPNFVSFMHGQDSDNDKYSKQEMLEAYANNGEADKVAQYYTDFLDKKDAKKNLSAHVVPTTQGSGSDELDTHQEKELTMGDIHKGQQEILKDIHKNGGKLTPQQRDFMARARQQVTGQLAH